MSGEAVGWALRQSTEGDSTTKLVLCAFASHADPISWVAWPAKRTVAAYAEIGERQAKRVVAKLEELDLIVRISPDELRDEDRERFERIRPDRRPTLYLVGGSQRRNSRGDTDDTRLGHGVTSGALRGDMNPASRGDIAMSPETSMNTHLQNAPASSKDELLAGVRSARRAAHPIDELEASPT